MRTTRRTALRAIATTAAGTLTTPIWAESLAALGRQQAHAHETQAALAAADWAPRVLTPQQNEAVITLTELIIPETDTPGARAARVNRFVDSVLAGAAPRDRERFVQGLAWMDRRTRALFGTPLAQAAPGDLTVLLTRLSAEGNPDREDARGREFFQALKSLTIDGYYTTEIGMRQELGDSGQLFLPAFPGCDHPEHQS